MNMNTYSLRFITPLFSYGALQDEPEIRPASIRGQLHWWFRAIGGTAEEEQQVFGTVHKHFRNAGKTKASALVIRVSNLNGTKKPIPTLPHKSGGAAAPRKAYAQGTSFHLHVLFRGKPLPDAIRKRFDAALEAWLAVGSLGLRSTRGAGSFVAGKSESQPALFEEPAQLQSVIQNINNAGLVRVMLLNENFKDSEAARRIISDTIGGRSDTRDQQNDLATARYPLGAMRPRKTSPLRFRVVMLDGSYKIVALWDARNAVTGNSDADLKRGIDLLVGRNKPIGTILKQSDLYRS